MALTARRKVASKRSGRAGCQESNGHEDTVIDMETGDSALYLLANVRGTANCIRYDSTA